MPRSECAQSEYEEDSEFVLSEDGGEKLPVRNGFRGADSPSSSSASPVPNSSPIPDSNQRFLGHVESVTAKVKSFTTETDWTRVLKHSTGVEVFAKKAVPMIGNKKTAPVFKGEGLIKGYSPASVFAVIGSNKLWDDWYEDGNLIENLSDEVSLTYMCMHAALGTRTRDLSLVEKVEATDDGSIYFCASSVDTPRVPAVAGRVRAHIEINAWVLEPVDLSSGGLAQSTSSIGTKVTYYLQVDVKTFIPEAISQRYLAKRPLCITKIDSYLQKHGSPIQVEGINESETHPHQGGIRKSFNRGFMSTSQLDGHSNSSKHRSITSSILFPASKEPLSQSLRSRRSHFISLGRSSKVSSQRALSNSISVPAIKLNAPRFKSSSVPPLPTNSAHSSPSNHVHRDDDQVLMIDHVVTNESATGFKALDRALIEFETELEDLGTNKAAWMKATNSSTLHKVWYKRGPMKANMNSLPLVASEVRIALDGSPALTKEQVLLTVRSSVARQVWDAHFLAHGYSVPPHGLLKTENGFDQMTCLGTMRGVYPHLPDMSIFCFDQMVVRQSPDKKEDNIHGKIFLIQRSSNAHEELLEYVEKDPLGQGKGLSTVLKEKLADKHLSEIRLSGWMIETGKTLEEIKLTHICGLDLDAQSSGPLPKFIEEIIIRQISHRTHQISVFIQNRGFFPGFVRWTGGDIIYLGDFGEFDANREVEWRFGRKSRGAAEGVLAVITPGSTEKQICWFQWSSKMYNSGIELSLDPPDAAKAMRVKKMDNTIQLEWTPSSASSWDLVSLRAKPMVDSQPVYPGDVVWNGAVLSEEVYPPVRSSKQKPSVKIKSRKGSFREQVLTPEAAVSKSNIARNLEQLSSTYMPGSNHVALHDIRTPSTPSHTNFMSPSHHKFSPTSIVGASSDVSTSLTTGHHHNKVLVDSNVMLIITQDLYFTKPQILFLSVCIGLAYVYGKFG